MPDRMVGLIAEQLGKRSEVPSDCVQFDAAIPCKLVALTEAAALALVVVTSNMGALQEPLCGSR